MTHPKKKYAEDIKLGNSVTLAKKKLPRRTKSILQKNSKRVCLDKSTAKRRKKDKNNTSGNTNCGLLDIFELDKEYILLYHLSILESKMI